MFEVLSQRNPNAAVSYSGTAAQASPLKAAQIYRKTGNLRAVQLLLGHAKVDSTVRYLGVELEDALSIAEKIDI